MIIPLVVSIIFFALVIYVLSWLFTNNTTLSAYSDATVGTVIPATSIPNATSINYSFSIWVYISDWAVNYNKAKVLFSRDGAKPMVKLGGTDNTLTTTIQMSDGTNAECTVPNIPIQKWTSIIITVNNKAVDTYLNGKLVKTCILEQVPMATTAANAAVNLTPNGGFSGFTARFKYWADYINPQEAWNVYRAGPGGNFLTNFFGLYKIQLNFLKGAETKASITI
jgi:hypothetical protein